jgi:spermidine/putrescine transport system permease protein
MPSSQGQAVKKTKNHVSEPRKALTIPYAAFLVLFVIFPILLIFFYAFTDKQGNFTLQNFQDVFAGDASNATFKVIGTSLGVAALTTVICIILAYPIAYILANSKYNKNKIVVYLFLLPMWINFVIRTTATRDMLLLIGIDYRTMPWVTSIIGMVYNYLPFAILPLYNQMLKLDKNQIEAAADLGANPVQVFTKAIIPQTIPGIVSACMMTFMPTMSSYVIANKMSENKSKIIGNIIESHFNSTVANSNNVGSVLSLVMLAIIGVSLLIEKNATNKPVERKGNVW